MMEWFRRFLLRAIEPIIGMPMESFFLPEKGTPRGSYWAAPNRFEVERDVRPVDPGYEEEVYDLETLRYPFKIQLMEDLPKRMIQQFRKSIAGKYTGSRLHNAWKIWQRYTRMEVFQSRSATASVVMDTWRFLETAFEVIHPNDRFIHNSYVYSVDERVKSNIHLKLLSSGERIVLGEALDARVAENYIVDLVKLASGELPSSFEGELPDKFVGHEAILAKVRHVCMSGRIIKLIRPII
jgi:hypothetical protein